MNEGLNLFRQASAIPHEDRSLYLTTLPETDLHRHLVSLFNRAEENSSAEITHGVDEFGRDIVMRRTDPYGEGHIGVVVKRSSYKNLSGRTAGPIDEIISQAKQAVAHPCQLREISSEKVNISGVWIAFFGRMTGNAMKRLQAETKDILGLRILVLNQLVDLFTRHYPEVFFEAEVIDYITKKIITFEEWSGFTNRDNRLSEWFVNPKVSVADGNLNLDDGGIPFTFGTERLSFGNLGRYMRRNSKLLLVGDPGSGKSTALRKIAVNLLQKSRQGVSALQSPDRASSNSSEKDIPILIDAVSTRRGKSISDLIEEELPPVEVLDRFNVSALIVDGLDEVSKESRDQILEQIFAECEKYQCCLIMSARKVPSLQVDVVGQAPSPVKVFDILPFELGDAFELVERVTSDSSVLTILKEGLARINHQMALTPLALEMLIDIAEAEREIPGSISEIFDRYSDLALGRFDSRKGMEVVFDYYIKKRFLSELAWREFKYKNRPEMPRKEFEEFLSRYLNSFGWDPKSFDILVGEIERSGILRINESVFFAHRSFLEFFAASWIVDNRQIIDDYEQLLVDMYFDLMWSEVTHYVVGLMKHASESLVSKITGADASKPEFNFMNFMIGRLLQAGWHSTTEVKQEGIKKGIASGEAVLEELRTMRAQNPMRIPELVPLFFLLMFSEYAYGSRTLLKETVTVLSEIPYGASASDFRQRLALTWAIRERCDPKQVAEFVNQAFEQLVLLEQQDELRVEERFASLLFLEQICEEDAPVINTIRRKSRRIASRDPNLRRMLPSLMGSKRSKP